MNRAVILAAGMGTRLRSLTENKPKCLIPFLGTTLLEQQISSWLPESDTSRVNIAAGQAPTPVSPELHELLMIL